MALGDLTISQLSAVAEESADHEDGDRNNDGSFDVVAAENEMTTTTKETSMAYVPQFIWFRELRHDEFEAYVPTAPANTGLVSKWRIKDRARYKISLDPTIDEVKRLCTTCRNYAKSERVLFHYNGYGVTKPSVNNEIWLFNKSYTQYIPLRISDLDSWLKTPSIYVFDCSAAGVIVNAFIELQNLAASNSSGPSTRDCILLAACEAHETLPQSAEYPADIFTSCLTTPIKMALRWFCTRSLFCESFDYSLIDRIPGRQTDRKTPLGELNWIFTAVTDTIAWNVLPHDLFQRLFRQDLLVASLFRNFLLAERIMRSANCSPISYPMLPPTHQHHMWDAWDMAAEICLLQLPTLLADPSVEFQPSSFFTDQLTAFELWLDYGSENKKPPVQLPVVLQVLLSQSHRFRALVLLGRFLDMGPWAVDLALSVGIFPCVLKLLQTTTPELRQILVFIWTKILAFDKSCQVDLVKDGGHAYFIRFLDSVEAYPEQRAMAAFVLAVIADGHRRGQEACIEVGLINVCLKHLQGSTYNDVQTEPLFLQWLCLCLGKLWEDFTEAQVLGLQADAPAIFVPLLSQSQPEVRAASIFALGTLLDVGFDTSKDDIGEDEDYDNEEKIGVEVIMKSLLSVVSDASPLVRAEVAVGMLLLNYSHPKERFLCDALTAVPNLLSDLPHIYSFFLLEENIAALARFAFGHKVHLKSVVAAYLKSQLNSMPTSLPSSMVKSSGSGYTTPTYYVPHGSVVPSPNAPLWRVGGDSPSISHDGRVSTISPVATPGFMHGSPLSDGSSHHSDSGRLGDAASDGVVNHIRPRPLDNSLYTKSVQAMCALAKDPSPRVAGLGCRVLSIIGIDQVFAKSVKSTVESTTSPGPRSTGLNRSSSWFDMSGGRRLPVPFRTPPVSPPQSSFLTGLRRVYSLDFRHHPMNTQDSALADPLLGSGGSSRASEHSSIPHSTIYNWSCGRFSKPLLTAADDNEEIISRREEKEKLSLDLITKCQHCSVNRLHNQIASWDTKFESGTRTALLHPFSPFVIASDESERIRVWNYKESTLLNSFDNHGYPDKGISKICLVNELDESLLLVASSDGNIRIWKEYTARGQQKLVSAFSSIQGLRPGSRRVNAVVDWQQQSGYLFASGKISSIMAWDLDKEQLVNTSPIYSDCSISALTILNFDPILQKNNKILMNEMFWVDLQVIGCSGPFQKRKKEEEMDAGSSGFCALQQEYKLVGTCIEVLMGPKGKSTAKIRGARSKKNEVVPFIFWWKFISFIVLFFHGNNGRLLRACNSCTFAHERPSRWFLTKGSLLKWSPLQAEPDLDSTTFQGLLLLSGKGFSISAIVSVSSLRADFTLFFNIASIVAMSKSSYISHVSWIT
ncbi:hypothetical protein H5410_052849, partial [Solanum commersonii]